MQTAAAAAPIVGMGLDYMGGREEARARQQANNLQYQQGIINRELQGDRDSENLQLSRTSNAEEKAYRDMLLKIMLEGYSDPTTGVSTKYKQGQGTVTSYSGDAADVIGADRRENLLRLIQDQAMSRRGREANELRRNDEGAAAASTLGEMQAPDPFDSKRVIADLIASRRRGVNEGYDKTTKQALTSDIRTGTSSNALIAELAKKRGESLSDAEAGGYTEGLGISEDLKGARTSRLGNKYNMLAGRASNQDDVAFAPQNLSSSGQSAAGNIRGSGGQPIIGIPQGRAGAPTFDPSQTKPNLQSAQNTYLLSALFDRAGQFGGDRVKKSGEY